MVTDTAEQGIQSLHVSRDVEIAAPIDITFEAILAELGPEGRMPDGTSLRMKIEAWPGGRWYRDLGDNAGHFWGHVQVIKPPTLLEISGPMFMSYPVVNHIQYRLTSEGSGTRLRLTHTALGHISPQHCEGVGQGWDHGLQRIREIAQLRLAAK